MPSKRRLRIWRDVILAKLSKRHQKRYEQYLQQIQLPSLWFENTELTRPVSAKAVKWAYLCKDAKIIYVHNTKCGSTTIKYALFKLTKGYPYGINTLFPEQNIHFSRNAFARQGLYPLETIRKACSDRNAFLFTFIRHPYQRAISAYYSKIVDDSHHRYFQIRDLLTCSYGVDLTDSHNPKNFYHFLNYLLETKQSNQLSDVHFLLQTDTIDFETTEFDFIGKIENFDVDLKKLSDFIEVKLKIELHKDVAVKQHDNKSSASREMAERFLGAE